ncbi:MAG: PGF-pre-PGF domain-containing protein [ANME-2 cluster archaeon]|nr:PGF-pre-PGF domain-containing protein [ANME-2 cluster archaeon]
MDKPAGRPDAGNGTVGNITANILADSNETLNKMLGSEYDRFAVKYGVWNSTQTIVMLSYPYPFDHWRVLNMLKGKRETVSQDSVELEWPTPRDLIRADSENTIKRTDSMIWVALDEAVTPSIKITRYNASTTPSTLTSRYNFGTGKYLDIEVSENVQNDTGDIIKYAWITMYYTASDLDRIDESKLKLYRFDEASGKWTKLNENMDWVFGTGVNTTNVELHGKSYEGYIWANVSHFSLYGLGTEIELQSDGGYDIIPMFEAVPELSFFKKIQLSAGVEEQVIISNISGIYNLSLTYPENINLMLYLSDIKSLPSGVPEASENVYSYFELLYTKFKTNIKVNPVTQIDFKVPKDWAGSKDGITLMHYDNGWKPINTELTGEDANNYYFRVEVESYSIFAIVQSPPKEAVQSQHITEATQDTDIPSTSLPATENNPFALILAILALLTGLGVVYYIIKRKIT